MPRYKKEIWSGDVYECEEYASGNDIYCGGEEETIPDVHTKKSISRLINANFGEGDLLLTLGHKDAQNYEQARDELAKFLRKLRRRRMQLGFTALKYVAVTELGQGRAYHYLILSGMPFEIREWTKLWGLGDLEMTRLEKGGDYVGLCNYIAKDPPEKQKKRWSQSKNLDRPKVLIRQMRTARPKERLIPPKGYRQIEQYDYESDQTGYTQYLRAVRVGGEDWSEGRPGKRDCFNYIPAGSGKKARCRGLNELYCEKEACTFYKRAGTAAG